jgi:acetyltransferase-like isoleucine patch superfamily enzyme
MTESNKYSSLTDEQVAILIRQACTAEDWSKILVTDKFDANLVSNSAFSGIVKIGELSGTVTDALGNEKPSCIYNAIIKNCTIGDNCRITNIGVHIFGYHIEEGVCIESAGTIQANENASFGCGTEINVLNEAGNRQVCLFEDLTAQFAYMLCIHRYRPKLI